MSTLKPKGDSIAHEFYKLMKKAEASHSGDLLDQKPVAEISEEDLENAYAQATQPGAMSKAVKGLGQSAAMAGESQETDYASDLESFDLKSMLRRSDSNESFALDSAMLSDIDEAYSAISKAEDGMMHTASEQRVLDGLQKIAAGLREKGESFASDVVLATANSIKGDLKKKAEHRTRMIGGLQKIAQEFYAEGEQLAGDMVQVTINKLGFDNAEFNNAFKEPDKSKFPKTADDIPRVYKEMEDAVKEAGDPFKEMDIRMEYGFVRETKRNGRHVIVFKLQSGGQGEYTKE